MDRTFQYTTYPGDPQGDIKEVMNPQGDPHLKKELDDLMHFRKLMLAYRLAHYKDAIPDIDIGVKRRNRELCKPYIQLFYGTNVQQEIEQTLQKFLDSKNNRKSTSQESVLLPIIRDLISSYQSATLSVSTIWDRITTTLEGQLDESGAFHTSDWKLFRNTITKLMCDKFGATKVHSNKGSVLTFVPDKLERIDRSYNAEIKIKATLKTVRETVGNSERSTSEMSRDYDNNVNRENDSDGSDGYDGSRGSASDINDNNPMVMTATNQENSSTTIEKGQGTVPGAVTPVTAVTPSESGNNTIDTQSSLATTIALQQRSETIQNAGDIYRSGANWYCRHCKIYGDKFYMEVHICKGYI